MATHHKRRKWKEFYITSFDDLFQLDSAWRSSYEAFGKGRVFEINTAVGFARTNLPVRDCRALFRHAGVRWCDYVTGIDDNELEPTS